MPFGQKLSRITRLLLLAFHAKNCRLSTVSLWFSASHLKLNSCMRKQPEKLDFLRINKEIVFLIVGLNVSKFNYIGHL